MIYGTGKWARNIGAKLTGLGYSPIFVGSNQEVAEYTRDTIADFPVKNLPVFIASSTKEHYNDLIHSLNLLPSVVFVEKGFNTPTEKAEARKLMGNVPIYFLSQRRYYDIIQTVIGLNESVTKCVYNWTVEKGISEWVYHINSLDNYIRNVDNEFYADTPGEYVIDNDAKFSIQIGSKRILEIDVTTELHDIHIILEQDNQAQITHKQTGNIIEMKRERQDCLNDQIKDIVANITNITKLERL